MQMLLNVGTQNSGFFSDNEIFTHILQKKKWTIVLLKMLLILVVFSRMLVLGQNTQNT